MTRDSGVSAAEAAAQQAAAAIAVRTGVRTHDVAVVLGSGWDGVRQAAPAGPDIPYTELTGFPATTVRGHAGVLRSTQVGASNVLLFSGRTHYYENRDAEASVQTVRTAAAAGCRIVVLTNGSGSLRPEWPPSTVVLIRDHINLTAASPLRGDRFVDMTDAYAPRLRDLARTVAPELPEGVYAQFIGPQYETPAEVRMAGTLGADLVGMSTALETIAARSEDLEVLGLSLVTNPAAGLSDEPIDADHILQVGDAAKDRSTALLMQILEVL